MKFLIHFCAAMKLGNWRCIGLISLLWLPRLLADDFDATTQNVGRIPGGLATPVNQLVTPVGTQVQLRGVRPNALALSPEARLIVTSGIRSELIAIDPETGNVLQHVPLPSDWRLRGSALVSSSILSAFKDDKLSFTGLVFSPDGRRIYLSNVNGDIKVFTVDKGRKISALSSFPLPLANVPGRKEEIPAGLAVSPDGKYLFVALNLGNRVAELDALSGKARRVWDVGVAPYDVVICRNKLYVSNWGGRRPKANSRVGPAGLGTSVRVDSRSIAAEGSVSVINLDAPGPAEAAEIVTGRHACGLAVSPNRKYVACANAGDDTVSIIATKTDKIVETICARRNPADLFGAQPDALAFDKRGRTLFVCNGTQNAVAVFKFDPPGSELLGLIPVGWFPGAIAYNARLHSIDVANIKSIGPGRVGPAGQIEFRSRQYYGSLSLVHVPSSRELASLSRKALADLRYPLLAQSRLPSRPGRPAQPVPERAGEPSVFQHVIYIIKENRTYDQILGDVAEGDGDATLCEFGKRVTPNEHQFVRDFVLLDNMYCCGILSADGHEWADAAIATDYMERGFAGWPRSYGGDDALIYSPAGFIWNDAINHHKTVVDFGEFSHVSARWKNPSGGRQPAFLDCYRDFLNHSNSIAYSNEMDIGFLGSCLSSNAIGWNLRVPDVLRASRFIQSLKQYEAAGNFPNLAILWLPDDHTSGTRFGSPTPEAQIADNDLAFGEVVDAVSHSSFWTNTCIFAVEDDPQSGWDHVSGYRTTAYVISAYTKRHTVVSTQYNQTSLIRTIELILGLPPMNQMDATATPMFDCFDDRPDFTPYNVVTNIVPLDEMNPDPDAISDPQLRKDALVSAKLPLEKEDQCPEDLFNHILWRAGKGHMPYPVSAMRAPDDD
ncbi:MAG: bifunctional YncE family protein/alkaline phosphatase family protein [Limisphaerales bacterium]